MSCRIAILGLGALVLLCASCTEPPSFRWAKYDPIPGIRPGDTPERVAEVLKTDPSSLENGYWADSYRFEMNYQVWHYKNVGRVIFARSDMRVTTSEADPRQPD